MDDPKNAEWLRTITFGTVIRKAVESVKEGDDATSAFMRLHKAFFIFRQLLPLECQPTLQNVLWHLIKAYPSLQRFHKNFTANFTNFTMSENDSVRVGAIVMDCQHEYVLLVKPPHNQCYSFPKRKKTPADSHAVGAMAEVEEEIGLRITILENSGNYLEKQVVNSTNIPISARYYFHHGVCLQTTTLRPHSKNEIGQIIWYNIEYLANLSEDEAVNHLQLRCELRAWRNIQPFLGDIQARSEERRQAEDIHNHGHVRPIRIVAFDASKDKEEQLLL